MTSDDELLDRIVERLRSAPTPEMPRELISTPAATPELTVQPAAKAPGGPWLVVAGRMLVASFLGLLLWRACGPLAPPTYAPANTAPISRQPIETARESELAVLDIDLTAPLMQLEASLDQLDVDIADLKRQAARLDARRMADRMLARH